MDRSGITVSMTLLVENLPENRQELSPPYSISLSQMKCTKSLCSRRISVSTATRINAKGPMLSFIFPNVDTDSYTHIVPETVK